MSRRTKLLITALFLVLLSVPAVYVALTWSTPNPLRFRIVEDQGMQKHPMSFGRRAHRFVVEVRNTGSVPIQLRGAHLSQRASPDIRTGMLVPWLPVPSHFTSSGRRPADPIPPGGAVCVGAIVEGEMDIRAGEVLVSYAWVSRTKGNCMRWSNHIIEYLPSKIQDHMPRFELTEDESLLDVSLLSTSTAPHPAQPPAPQ